MYSNNNSFYGTNPAFNYLQPNLGYLDNRLSYLAATASLKANQSPIYLQKESKYRLDQPKVRDDEWNTKTHSMQPEVFLLPDRPVSQFVSEAKLIEPFVREAFAKTTRKEFPADIVVNVCSPIGMMEANKNWHPSIVGFSKNRLGFGVSEIFLLQNQMDALMVTAGHELGHVIALPAQTHLDEEAKAFAFESAFLETLWREDIAGLRSSINFYAFTPAANGLHNVAFDFVRKQIFFGKRPLELFNDLCWRKISVSF
jgi:hypothetical protein